MLIILLLLSGFSVQAFEFPQVQDQWLRAAPPGANMMAAYLKLDNNSTDARTLIAAYSPDFAAVEIHQSVSEDGMARMQHQESLTIEAGMSLSFQPGGLHLMLMNPKKAIKINESILICLIYQLADGQEVQHIYFPVKKK
ncbi:MAG: copper chaperone PCu(A)C [Proteobacteria bacterium]|nr:copper chaperone PCu(A)C [Pseudomonadota bacterium]